MSELATDLSSAPHQTRDSRAVLKHHVANELFFAVVGPVGAGCTRVADTLKKALEAMTDYANRSYQCEIIKASALIRQWATDSGITLPLEPIDGLKTLDYQRDMQNLGDRLRQSDHAALSRSVVQEIAQRRAAMMGVPYELGRAVEPDGKPRAYVVDSVKHPSEAMLFRRVYGDAFGLIGVVCNEPTRKLRILKKFYPEAHWKTPKIQEEVNRFMERDGSDEENPYGQHVTDVFHEADYFVDNSKDDPSNEHEFLNDSLGRLVDIISHKRIHRPSIDETAMHVAMSAKLRSACLSRQVGAALVDMNGNIIATGSNEVPKAGGGVYGENFGGSEMDSRCAFHREGVFCRNNKQQNKIIKDFIDCFSELYKGIDNESNLSMARKKTRLGGLLEFSRAIHAEMDAILSAARVGTPTTGARLFVTTFPCHYCARHIVSAGVYEVQFIEPYPKSLALELHDDAIESNPDHWLPPQQLDIRSIVSGNDRKPGPSHSTNGKVLFRPFVGVAPRLYSRAFLKDREYKDKTTGEFRIGESSWGGSWSLPRVSYPELEALLGESQVTPNGGEHA